ncbi:hypothetical protein CC86DRAFT_277586 [Ophiobolus disseminans]|uniref:DNA replication regulator Sld3 C-terminal domain-containing protein n=1 Tax=Ophiobolus disseminans TaxID=1469910 RepID=A0A6A7AIC0_9PLEO|nr:hypothetical protein CC86DRAFT_277586 [Ophiobolus disseminans]
MLDSVSKSPIQLLGRAPTARDTPKAPLPSKRKRDAICGLGTSDRPFAIKPHPGSPYDKPATFEPVRVIGRSQLPLTFLDTTADESFAANTPFSAYIDVLEKDDGLKKKEECAPKVLIARYETKRTLYAIERVQARVYSICRLASWLKEKDVTELWDPSTLQAYSMMSKLGESAPSTGEWWQHATVETQPTERPTKRARMAMMRTKLVVEPAKEDATHRFDSPVAYETQATNSIPVDPADEQAPQPPAPQQQLESLVQQYLDAVYLSKTSLAYFAKGPITRIRNAFTSSEEGAPSTHELVTFLRTMLISPKASEKKYYEKLPAIIRALPPVSFSDEDVAGASKAKKSKKKLKLSREGMYPHEEVLVKKWWMSDVLTGENRGDETMDQRIKRRIGDLRVRDTLAQLTLMLEVIALEALSTYKTPPEEEAPSNETQPHDDTQAKPTKRKRKLDDIALQLDLLLDRLCIWHATEEAGILDFDTKPTQQYDDADVDNNGGASDRLRSYCVEVIIPFYMNRLPEQALMINKKLGGPAYTSPPKRKATKAPTTSRKSEDSKEPEAKKSRKSLTRVATENMRRTADRATPFLSRSATDSALLKGIKREGRRELDLTTPSAAVTAKLKQKQRVEEELKDAILALKKPNRGRAAGGYVEDLERRSLGPASRSRKQPNPMRKVVKDIQVTATPRVGRRTKDIVEQTPNHHYHTGNPFARLSTSAAPPSSDFFIPSSGARQPAFIVPGTVHRSATARQLPRSSTGIAETPSRAPHTKTFESGSARRTIFATPLKSKSLSREQNFPPASLVSESLAKVMDSSPPGIAATPTKPTRSPSAEPRPTIFAKPSQAEQPSIYAALGWDDDDDMY